MLICLDLHAKGFMPYFPMFYASLSSRLMIRVICSHICICCWLRFARIYVFMHFLPCLMLRSISVHVYMLGFIFFHVYVLSFYMFTCMFLCLYVQIYVLICLCVWIYVLYMPYAIFHAFVRSMPCLCAQTQAMFVTPCAIITLLSICLSLLCFGLMVGTQSRPYGFCHRLYTLAHIRGFGSPLFACLCLLTSMLYACVSLSSSRLCHA